MAVTEYEANLRLTAALHGAAYQGPASYWAELVSDTPSRTLAGTPSGLVRIQIVCATAITNNGDGTGDNGVVWTFPAPATDLDECSYLELWDDEFAGNRRFFDLLSKPVSPLADLAVTVPIGNFTWTEV